MNIRKTAWSKKSILYTPKCRHTQCTYMLYFLGSQCRVLRFNSKQTKWFLPLQNFLLVGAPRSQHSLALQNAVMGKHWPSLGTKTHTWDNKEILTRLVNLEEISSASIFTYNPPCKLKQTNEQEIKDKIKIRNRKKMKVVNMSWGISCLEIYVIFEWYRMHF